MELHNMINNKGQVLKNILLNGSLTVYYIIYLPICLITFLRVKLALRPHPKRCMHIPTKRVALLGAC